MNKTRLLLAATLTTISLSLSAQGAKNIVISEVLTQNTQSIVDEFGNREAWIELANTSFTTYDVRGMFITTDRSVLDKSLSAPERISRMSIIPNGESRTSMGARKHLVLFCNSTPTKGKLHLNLPIPESGDVWVALYNGNGVELIDSVTIPRLEANQSYARTQGRWSVKAPENVTAGMENYIATSETKVEKFKREDPHGFAMAIMAMSIVFSCLATLWIFFTLFGIVMRRLAEKKKTVAGAIEKKMNETDQETDEMDVYMAVIGLAFKQYMDDIHDTESGIITIKPKDTGWDDEYTQMTHFRDGIIPTVHNTPNIPTTPEIH